MLVVFTDADAVNCNLENELNVSKKVMEELRVDNVGWSLSCMGSSVCTIKQWNEKVREGLRWDLDRAVSLISVLYYYSISSI